jgi:hypothetical protein
VRESHLQYSGKKHYLQALKLVNAPAANHLAIAYPCQVRTGELVENFNYLVGLVSIVIGLGLAEVAGGMNRLLRNSGSRHDVLIFGPPLLVTLMLVSVWFDVWAVRRIPNIFGFPFFVVSFTQLMMLYLLAAWCVPQTAGEGTKLTSKDYEQNRPYFWRLFSIYQLLYVSLWVFFQIKKGSSALDLMERGFAPSGAGLQLVVGIGLALTRNRFAQGAGVVLLIIWLFIGYWSQNIS